MNKIIDLIVEIEREERVNDKDFKETLSLLYEANKHYKKALTIHSVVDTFFCGVKGGYCLYEEKDGRCTQKSSCINKVTK